MIGIECVGVVEAAPSGSFLPGARVVAVVGGMARDRNGSYAERVTVPAANVAEVDTGISWGDLAALPEVYATAWTALHRNLALEPGQTLLVRGATSALGQAAVNLAVDLGASVFATTRSPEHVQMLKGLGTDEVLIDGGSLAETIPQRTPRGIDAVLDIVGNSVLRDSLQAVRANGRVCQVGFLGGLAPVDDFNPLLDLPSGVQLSFFASAFVLGNEDYPLSDVPFEEIAAKAASGAFDARVPSPPSPRTAPPLKASDIQQATWLKAGRAIWQVEREQASRIAAGETLRAQASFDAYLLPPCQRFVVHGSPTPGEIGGAIEE